MGKWEEKTREIMAAGSGAVWEHCKTCKEMMQFDGKICKKCGTANSL